MLVNQLQSQSAFIVGPLNLYLPDAPQTIDVKHHFQVNGTLINQDWCAFFEENNVSVGISVDGPQEIHDRYRRRRNGTGTFAQVQEGIDLLSKSDVDVSFVAVLTKDSIRCPDLIFSYFEDIGAEKIAFNIEEIEASHVNSSMKYQDVFEDCKLFLKRYINLIELHNSKQFLREINRIKKRIFYTALYEISNELVEPFSIISVAADGSISTFCPELLTGPHPQWGSFALGNVKIDNLDSILAGKSFQNLYDEIRIGVDCCRQSCDFFSICGGGAPANKIWENGCFDSTETSWCRFNIMATTDTVIGAMADQIKGGGDVGKVD